MTDTHDSRFDRRSSFSIIASLLETAIVGAPKARIIDEVKMNSSQARDYLSLLLDCNLVKPTKTSKTTYKTTQKGWLYLQFYKNLIILLE